jgi:hypothetical protein
MSSSATAVHGRAVAATRTLTKVRVATQGDDLGTNHTTNLAFVEAYRKGVLRNVSLLACTPFIEEGAEMLAGEKGL